MAFAYCTDVLDSPCVDRDREVLFVVVNCGNLDKRHCHPSLELACCWNGDRAHTVTV